MSFVEWLNQCPVIAILRGIRPEEVEEVFDALFEAGIRIAEIPLNSPEPFLSIQAVAQRYGDRMLLGAGTVTQAIQVQQVIENGGRLIVTPHAEPSIVHSAKSAGLIAVPGFATATEAFSMLDAGADALKLFPADHGGIALFKALRAVLPVETRIIPVGGVDASSISSWKDAGVAGFGIGSALYRAGDSAKVVAERAQSLLQLIA